MPLNREPLSVYLNDHLAGASAALELLDALEDMPGFKEWVSHIRGEIAADRQELENLMSRLGVERGAVRQVMGTLAGKFGQLKTRVEDPSAGALQRLELLETISLGIEGKRTLWVTLQSLSATDSAAASLDYARLIPRAIEQRRDVEARRLEAASDAMK